MERNYVTITLCILCLYSLHRAVSIFAAQDACRVFVGGRIRESPARHGSAVAAAPAAAVAAAAAAAAGALCRRRPAVQRPSPAACRSRQAGPVSTESQSVGPSVHLGWRTRNN